MCIDELHDKEPVLVRTPFVRVAVPVPLRKTFDYRRNAQPTIIGARVRVPFGRRSVVGIVVGATSQLEDGIVAKAVDEVLDDEAVISPALMELLIWAAAYYHQPIGEVVAASLPPRLRRGEALRPNAMPRWALTPQGREDDLQVLQRSPLGKRLVEHLRRSPGDDTGAEQLRAISQGWRSALDRLVQLGWIEERAPRVEALGTVPVEAGPTLEPDQQVAVDTLLSCLDGFQVNLLHGITGSGKTEVYLRLLEQIIATGRQALVLVPEISLTPQLVDRVQRRLGMVVAVLHSGIAEQLRHRMWWAAASGEAMVVLGTRSAVFAPLPKAGIVIIDEEHDSSFKQQDGFRYHGRDVAIMRAQLADVPVILGSATPSVETMENVHRQRYQRVTLPKRTGGAELPRVHVVDLNTHTPDAGLSPLMIQALAERLQAREQSLLFINRRGFAPVVMCVDCGWTASCQRCDAKLTYHQAIDRWRCHHCGAEQRPAPACPECHGSALVDIGEGTERIEDSLAQRFPEARLLRLDRDVMTSAERLRANLKLIADRRVDIVVGTQMVTKGHDFPQLTLVGVINTDQALFSIDYRTPEHLMQQLTQVSGRAGRGTRRGEVMVQTRYPRDPVFSMIARHDYEAFLDRERAERRSAGLPPYAHLALIRAEAATREQAMQFLNEIRHSATGLVNQAATMGVELMDPVPSPMERRAGRYRAQLLVRCVERAPLHNFLKAWLDVIEQNTGSRRLRWSIDVDPVDLY